MNQYEVMGFVRRVFILVSSYMLCDINNFYNKDEYFIPIQQELLPNEGKPEISVKLKNKLFHNGFKQYRCHHDFKHNVFGKVYGNEFNYFLEPLNFNMFKNNDIALISVRKEVALDFISHLSKTNLYDLTPVEVNFTNMYPLITEVSGAWIADLKRAHVRTAAFFGPNVNKSNDFLDAANEGNVSSIRINFVFREREYSILISKDGIVVIQTHVDTFEDEIDLIMDIYEKLINPARS